MKAYRFSFVSLVSAVFIVSILVYGGDALAAVAIPTYDQLENIPGAEGSKTFPQYVVSIYNLALGVIGISAVFMLSVGGFMYVTSAGNTAAAGSAKGVIKDALIGLVLGLATWLIVGTINPDLTQLNTSGLTTGTSTPQGAAAPVAATPGTVTGSSADTFPNVSFLDAGSCSDAAGVKVSPASNIAEFQAGKPMTVCNSNCPTVACTGQGNPSAKLIAALKGATTKYNVTSLMGGAHAPDSAHYSGTAMDIQGPGGKSTSANAAEWRALRDTFPGLGSLPVTPNQSGTFCETKSNKVDADCSNSDHIHVRF